MVKYSLGITQNNDNVTKIQDSRKLPSYLIFNSRVFLPPFDYQSGGQNDTFRDLSIDKI